ncbi:MAG: class F sortase [Chloroflexi bacterium]|nr:class F sortase [Chloroflexota bacterium]
MNQMSRILERLDRRFAIGALVLAASVALLVAGLVSVLSALTDDPLNLPNEGSLESILEDSIDPEQLSTLVTSEDAGPPPAAPVRLSIPRLYVDAPVITLGVNEDRIPEVPDTGSEVAWYDFSASPGDNNNAVLSGHVDWQTRDGDPIPGVFYRLREAEIGDVIQIDLEDGTVLQYRVTGNVAAEFDDPNVLKAMGPASKDVLTLVTCGGTWFNDRSAAYGGNYSHRIVVRAERMPELADAGIES